MAYTVSVKVKVNNKVKIVSVKREYQSKEAATKAGKKLLEDIRESGMNPEGSFIIRNSSGKEVRPYMESTEYDNLYHFINPEVKMGYMKYYEQYKNVVPILSKRYDTLDAARKGALAKSKELWKEVQTFGRERNISMEVYKGQRYLGSVSYNVLKGKKEGFDGYEGIWNPAGHEKDELHLKKDGSLL